MAMPLPLGPPMGISEPRRPLAGSVVGLPSSSSAQPRGMDLAQLLGRDQLAQGHHCGRHVQQEGVAVRGGSNGEGVRPQKRRFAAVRRNLPGHIGAGKADRYSASAAILV